MLKIISSIQLDWKYSLLHENVQKSFETFFLFNNNYVET